MSTSETDTTAASAALDRLRKAAHTPSAEPKREAASSANATDSSRTEDLQPLKTPSTVPPRPFKNPTVPSTLREVPHDRISARIAHPVPRKLEENSSTLDEILLVVPENTHPGPASRHLDRGTQNSAAPNETGLREMSADSAPISQVKQQKHSESRENAATSGGFALINDWLDSFKDPDWQVIGDKVYTSPRRLKSWLTKVRIERAQAAELRERTRLLEEAHTEALAENTKRIAAQQAEVQRLEYERLDRECAAEEKIEQESFIQPPSDPGFQLLEAPSVSSLEPETVVAPVAPRKGLEATELAALVSNAKAAIAEHQAHIEPIYVAPYVLPDNSPSPAPTSQDLIRRIFFSLIALVTSIGAIWATGDLANGSLAGQHPRSSLFSLAPTAYLLLPVVFGGALISSSYAWIPAQRSANRQRAVGWQFSAALVAGGLWLVFVKLQSLPLACIAAILCAALLVRSVRTLNENTARNTYERIFTDAPISLMTGFFLVIAAASLTELLASFGLFELPEILVAVGVAGLGYFATTLAMSERGRIILATGFGWGMFWLLVPRLLGPNPSLWVAAMAGMAGFVVILATENRRYQIHHAEHRAERGKRTEF